MQYSYTRILVDVVFCNAKGQEEISPPMNEIREAVVPIPVNNDAGFEVQLGSPSAQAARLAPNE